MTGGVDRMEVKEKAFQWKEQANKGTENRDTEAENLSGKEEGNLAGTKLGRKVRTTWTDGKVF